MISVFLEINLTKTTSGATADLFHKTSKFTHIEFNLLVNPMQPNNSMFSVSPIEIMARTLFYLQCFLLYRPALLFSFNVQPAWEEPCTPEGCVGHSKRGGFPVWAIVLISLTSVAAAGGLAFAGFVIYKRFAPFSLQFESIKRCFLLIETLV